MGLWDGYPGENAWDTAQTVTPAFAPVEPPEPPKSPPWVPAPPPQKLPDIAAEPYAAPSQPRPMGPRFGGPVDSAISDAAKRHGVDENWLRTFAKIESGGNPRNTTGSYKGLFQLSNSEFAKHGGQGDIYDPVANSNAAAIKLRAQSEAFRNKYGRDPTAADIYMIHQQGEGGYDMHSRNPDQPAWVNMARTAEGRQKGAGWARQAIWGNVPDDVKKKYGSVDNMTSRDFLDLWRNKVARFSGDTGAPPASAPAAPGPVASASPRSKPMPDQGSTRGFFSFLNDEMNLFGNPQNADILSRAGPQGYQPVDGAAFLRKHGLDKTPGAQDMLAISNMQKELLGSALQQPRATWGQGIGEALKGIGAVLTSRVDPKMAMTMAGNVGQSHREQQELVRKMQMQALLQQAQGLGGNLADVIKDRIALQNKKEELAAQNAYIDGGQGTGTAVPNVSLTSPGGVATAGAPTGAVAREAIPPVPSATAAPVVSGETPPAGIAPASTQPPATPSVPDIEKQIKDLRSAADRASRIGNKDRASNLMDQAKALQESVKDQRTNDIRGYEYAVRNDGYKGSFEKWLEGRQKGGVRFGLTPIPVKKADGTYGYAVANTAGEAKALTMPDGSELAPKLNTIDTPTAKLVMDPYGNVVQTIPKDISGAQIQEQRGQAIGKAQVDLGKVEANAKTLKGYIDAVREDANLPNVLGYNAYTPTVRPESRATEARINQLKGKAFLSAFESLKGAGAITEVEGAKATNALARLEDLKIGTPAFKEALDDFMKEVDTLTELSRKRASGTLPGPTSTVTLPQPKAGGISIRRLD